MGDVDNGGDARRETGQHIDSGEPAAHAHARIARPIGRMADGVQAPSVVRAVEPPADAEGSDDEHEELRRHDAADVALAENEEARREAGVVLDAAR